MLIFKKRDPTLHTMVVDGKPLTYRYIHKAGSTNGKIPMLIGLHGHGSDESQIASLVGLDIDQPHIYIAPRGFIALADGGFSWFALKQTSVGFEADADSVQWGLARLAAFIPLAVKATNTHTEQVYFIGYSVGGGMSLAFTLAYPHLIAGAVSMAGQLTPSMRHPTAKPQALMGKPLFIGHGIFDSFISVEAVQTVCDQFGEMGSHVTYREYPIPHVVSAAERQDVSLWITSQMSHP